MKTTPKIRRKVCRDRVPAEDRALLAFESIAKSFAMIAEAQARNTDQMISLTEKLSPVLKSITNAAAMDMPVKGKSHGQH